MKSMRYILWKDDVDLRISYRLSPKCIKLINASKIQVLYSGIANPKDNEYIKTEKLQAINPISNKFLQVVEMRLISLDCI